MFFAPVSLFFCFSIEEQKLEETCSHFTLYTPTGTYNVKLLRLPKALNIALCMCPKKTLGTMIFQSNLSLWTPLYYGQFI